MKSKTFSREQLLRLTKTLIIAVSVMLVFELIFSFPGVSDYFTGLIGNSSGILAYAIIFLLMFLQTNILNIAAISIISVCDKIGGIEILSIEFIGTVLVAYMLGACFSYWIGRKFGAKAVKWISGSEEDFDKWTNFFNQKKSKFFYFLTILFPIFPDDILCLCAGSVRMNFKFYFFANLLGRGIGLVSVILFLKLVGITTGGFPYTLLIMWSLALISLIVFYIILKYKERKGK